MAKSHYIRWPFMVLGSLFIICACTFWPGILSPDSTIQYNHAREATYTDHNPPAMTFVWHYLDLIYPGPGLLFMLHMLMLYAASAVFICIFKDSRFKWWFVVLPLIPNIFSYTPLIVKDISFTYSYLLSAAILAYLMVGKLRVRKYQFLSLVILLLLYGTGAKYQARFLLLFFTLGIGYCLNYKLDRRALLAGFALYLAVLLAMLGFNAMLVSSKNESHSWQLVKLYDMSAISLYLDRPMYPGFVQANPNFDFTKIKQQFSQSEIDPLVFGGADTLLIKGTNMQQRDQLWNYWRDLVLQHPWLYLKSRFWLWSHNFFSVPSKRSNPSEFLRTTRLGYLTNNPVIYNGINSAYKSINVAFQFIWLVPLLLLYTYLAVSRFKRNSYAPPLLMFCSATILMLAILFFFSMAATARYIFICTCLMHISHAFAYKSWRASYVVR